MVVTDFLVIGGGVIGINIARTIKSTFGDSTVTLIEKEPHCGMHASGRNSGVLHAGFYYAADSLKAKFTSDGNRSLTEYCENKRLKINKCGKLVVAQTEDDLNGLDELLRRGEKNEIQLEDISEEEARRIEPRIRTCGRAIFSPTTSSVDPHEVMSAMRQDALGEGVTISSGVRFLNKKRDEIKTSAGSYSAGYTVNASGLYADKVATQFGFSRDYRILPFKGLYLYSSEPPFSLKTNVYPVPNLLNPFLGVHFTLTVDGRSKIGPTAIPAFWREQYVGFENFNIGEAVDIVLRQLGLLVASDFNFRKLALDELKKYSRARMVRLASSMVNGVNPASYRRWGRPGIRAQLLNTKTNKLEMDFVIEADHKSMHVLNAVSPAFTCALPFSQYVCNEISKNLH